MLLHLCILVVLDCLCSFQPTGDTKAQGDSDEEAGEAEKKQKDRKDKDRKGRKDRMDRRDRKDRRAERYGRTLVDRLYIRLSISKVVFVGQRLDAFSRVQCQVRGQAGRTVLMYAAECGLDDVAWLVPKDPCIFSYLHFTSSQTKLLWFTFYQVAVEMLGAPEAAACSL